MDSALVAVFWVGGLAVVFLSSALTVKENLPAVAGPTRDHSLGRQLETGGQRPDPLTIDHL